MTLWLESCSITMQTQLHEFGEGSFFMAVSTIAGAEGE